MPPGHYRVPQNLYEGQKRGKPSAAILYPYQRGEGFSGLSDPAPPTSRGGMTFCDVYEGENLVVSGCARCSYADNFNYRNGRLIAEGRAEKKYKVYEDTSK